MKDFLKQKEIINLCDKNYQSIIDLQNVVGLGLGEKYINNKNTYEKCIHVLVKKKLTPDLIHTDNLIPKIYKGLKTDVIEFGIPKLCFSTGRSRPLQGGYSIGPKAIEGYTGTLGCIVFKNTKKGKEYFALSNNHVLAGGNKFPIGLQITQPGADDFGIASEDLIGVLYNFIPVKFIGLIKPYENYVDCAIAKLTNFSLASRRIQEIGNVKGISKAYINLEVIKIGRTTDLTEGKVNTIGTTIKIKFGKFKSAIFKDQIVSDNFVKGGDSGSLLLNKENKAVGLVFALVEGKCISNNIQRVLDSLNVSIYSEEK